MVPDAPKSAEPESDPRASSEQSSQKSIPDQRVPAPFILTFLILAVFWLIFSGKFDTFHLFLGMVSCLIVATLSSDLFFPSRIDLSLPKCWFRFARYIPWLLYQVFLANLHVLYLTFHPKMMDMIDPHIITFDSHLKSDVAHTTFANSITLTPGTITVSVNAMGGYTVHCIDQSSGQALPGEMERRVGVVFRE
jgi:multicomponent Na+:H+ antiporter subunit E